MARGRRRRNAKSSHRELHNTQTVCMHSKWFTWIHPNPNPNPKSTQHLVDHRDSSTSNNSSSFKKLQCSKEFPLSIQIRLRCGSTTLTLHYWPQNWSIITEYLSTVKDELHGTRYLNFFISVSNGRFIPPTPPPPPPQKKKFKFWSRRHKLTT